MTKKYIITLLILILVGCVLSSPKPTINGEYYIDNSFNESGFCPLFITINDNFFSVLYSNNNEIKKFKYSNKPSTEKFTLDLGDSNVEIKLLIKKNGFQLINKSKSFVFGGKDTLDLLPFNKKSFNFVNRKIKGYWYSEDFFQSLKKPKTWIKLTKDSITVSVTAENTMNLLIHKKNEIKINNYKTVSILGINQIYDDRNLFIDKIDDHNIQLLLKECNDYKSYIHLKKISFNEYQKRKIKQEAPFQLD